MHDERADPADFDPIREHIERGLVELGLEYRTPAPAEALARLVLLLAQWAPRMNLTGHRDPFEMASRLILDAAGLALALPELQAAPDLADLGSGAGFPGLPIAILHPHLSVYLVESRQKRHHFQREARRQLGLANAHPTLGRSDEVEIRPCQIAVAQAMAQPASAFRSLRPWTRPGGLMVLPASAGSRPPALEGDLQIEQRRYRVPSAEVDRLLWIAQVPPVRA